jgi:hypothetical protein
MRRVWLVEACKCNWEIDFEQLLLNLIIKILFYLKVLIFMINDLFSILYIFLVLYCFFKVSLYFSQ